MQQSPKATATRVKERRRLVGVKEIAFFVAQVTALPFSPSAVTRASATTRRDPLPVHYGHGGFVYGFEDEVRAWAERPGIRRRPRRKSG
jgi:hypothetical protein